MPRVRKADRILWFAHIEDGDDLVQLLDGLDPCERITLVVNGVAGIWERMQNHHGNPTGKPTRGIRPTGDASAAWNAISDGQVVDLSVIDTQDIYDDQDAVEPPDNESQAKEEIPRRPAGGSSTTSVVPLTRAFTKDPEVADALCIGLDFAWWGGQAARDTQWDSLVYSIVSGQASQQLQVIGVDLRETFNPNAGEEEPNCDPNADLVIEAVRGLLEHLRPARVVLAVDAPLRAVQGGERRFRQCERTALATRRAHRAGYATEWDSVWTLQPGAPVHPRVQALCDRLCSDLGFNLYECPNADVPNRLLIECFPGEAIWALGMRGHFGPISPGEAMEYKRPKIANPRAWRLPSDGAYRPWPTVIGWAWKGLYGFGASQVIETDMFNSWMVDLSRHFLGDDGRVLDNARRNARRGKSLDDLVDSVNCFLTAVAFVRNRAHVWIGEDPADGHIIGPGL